MPVISSVAQTAPRQSPGHVHAPPDARASPPRHAGPASVTSVTSVTSAAPSSLAASPGGAGAVPAEHAPRSATAHAISAR